MPRRSRRCVRWNRAKGPDKGSRLPHHAGRGLGVIKRRLPRLVLASHPAVAECAVIGVSDQLKGQVPRGFVVLKAGCHTDPGTISAELVRLVRNRIGPVAALRQVDVVTALPKTRSGKILRKTMRSIADGNDEQAPSTIDDPAALDALRPVLRGSS